MYLIVINHKVLCILSEFVKNISAFYRNLKNYLYLCKRKCKYIKLSNNVIAYGKIKQI